MIDLNIENAKRFNQQICNSIIELILKAQDANKEVYNEL